MENIGSDLLSEDNLTQDIIASLDKVLIEKLKKNMPLKTYNKVYYEEHKKEILEKAKLRNQNKEVKEKKINTAYKTNPEYRLRVIEQGKLNNKKYREFYKQYKESHPDFKVVKGNGGEEV